jgi:2'-5' RNA ligase
MSGSKLRLFVAANIPGEARGLLGEAIRELQGKMQDARWVRPENLHLTLKFIGYYEEEGLERLSSELRAATERCRPFQAALGGCGSFPSQRKARVVWVGMATGAPEAEAVARKLDARLEKVGVQREKRGFRGHLTLARIKQPHDCTATLEDMVLRLEGLKEMPFEVDEVVLYRSILRPQGPEYTALQRFSLGGMSSHGG